jgi:micrococcal nuclease
MIVSRGKFAVGIGAFWAFALAAGSAWADPCKAIPDRGPPPAWIKPGEEFSGLVRYVGDGDSICIGSTADPAAWVEIRLEDFFAPELSEPGGSAAKAEMELLTRGQTVSCRVTTAGRAISYDRVVATCRVRGRSLGDSMRAAGITEAGRGWRP